MNFLKRLFAKAEEEAPPAEVKPQKYHCIRFMTDRGEQVGMLLTHDEFETAVNRWVSQISSMPVQEELDEEQGVL
jgi:hypothetical protein